MPMTPLRRTRAIKTPLFGDSDDEEKMDESLSPPRTSNKKLPTARLFGGIADDYDAPDTAKRSNRKRYLFNKKVRSFGSGGEESLMSDLSGDESSVLRSIDINMSSPNQRRKRQSDHRPAGREEQAFEESEDDLFYKSPRISPSFRTLDGRTVTSKNPFSPYPTPSITDDATTQAVKTAPSFPMSLGTKASSSFDSQDTSIDEGTSLVNASGTECHLPKPSSLGPCKIHLERRDQQSHPPRQQQQNGMVGTTPAMGGGYPDRHGQYSFTGSPIEEIDILETDSAFGMGSKVRRLNLNEDCARTKAGEERHPHHRATLVVDTDQASNEDVSIPNDDISPTDVMSFPAPPTPSKPDRRHQYTPLKARPPQTPMLERRTVARRSFGGTDDEDEDDHHLALVDTASRRPPPKSRFNDDFDIIGQLGNGSFGTVYKCLSRLDGCMYAIKAAKRKAKGVADLERMLKEVYALAALSDQADTAAFHIVRYHQAWMEENRLYIQTELCTSTLHAEMSRGGLDEKRRYKLLREMLLALEFIHRNGMVHLDIKPENIFVKNDQYKLGDFGLVSKISNHDVEEGDSRYMSMELLSGDHEDLTKSDIFSLGATMYEICLGRPLPSEGQEWQNIRAETFSPLPSTPPEMELMIKQMMHPDPHSRPKASELLKRRQLLSEEQKQLMTEKNKVLEANMALALQTQRLKKISPPPPSRLVRANTWNGTLGC